MDFCEIGARENAPRAQHLCKPTNHSQTAGPESLVWHNQRIEARDPAEQMPLNWQCLAQHSGCTAGWSLKHIKHVNKSLKYGSSVFERILTHVNSDKILQKMC